MNGHTRSAVIDLHHSVRRNDVEGVRFALNDPATAHALANSVDHEGYTPLLYAVSWMGADQEIVRALLDAGADFRYVLTFDVPPMEDPWAEFGMDVPGGLEIPSEVRQGYSYKVPLIRTAVEEASIDTLRTLREYGADFTYRDRAGNTALHDVFRRNEDPAYAIDFLSAAGLDVNAANVEDVTPLMLAYEDMHVGAIKALLTAGAREEDLGWTPLMRAIAMGDEAEIEEALAHDPQVAFRDQLGRNAFELGLLMGNLPLVKRLRTHLTVVEEDGPEGSLVCLMASGGDGETIGWLIEQGCDVDGRNANGDTALSVAAERGDLALVHILLQQGADPNAEVSNGPLLSAVTDPETLALLLEYGADPNGLEHEGRRALLGLTDGDDPLDVVSHEEYLAGCHAVETESNPEETTGAYRVAMIRAGHNAWTARQHFGDERDLPAWCAQRFGQTITRLPDGRTILIAGEHEDYYDPDFCIYNDVIVFHPDRRVQIFGYPYRVFPPTDFHSATLVDDQIYIMGSLGYLGSRQGGMPVWRLDTKDYRIESIRTFGRQPGRIHKHRAELVEGNVIVVSGGTRITVRRDEEDHTPNTDTFRLDLRTLTWS
jgi:ankyrin repeat protein